MKTSRNLFADGWNSFWHVFFGTLSFYMPVVTPNFVIYQLIDYLDVNLFVDLGEFVVGLLLIVLLYNLSIYI